MKPIKKHRKLKIFLIALAVTIVLFIAGMLCIRSSPQYKEIKETVYDSLTEMNKETFIREGNTEIYDAENKLIGRIGNERYKYLTIDEIPETITKGYIATEDRNFYTHHGVDPKATARAVVKLVTNFGKITQGGSTITMQTVKNNLLSQEQTFTRKFTEMYLALEMEKEFNKAEIMEFYCNSCYYGQNCYGIEGASEYYFGKKAKELTLGEAAMLVGISNSPNNYNPVASYELAMKRKEIVLENMAECGYITEEEKKAAVKENPEIVQKSENVKYDSYQITYAVHCAALKIMELDGFDFQYTFDTEKDYDTYSEKYDKTYSDAVSEIRNGGYQIYTSLDTSLQKQLQNAVDNSLSDFTKKDKDGRYMMQGASMCIDNESQMVVAVVGGRGTKDQYNRAYQAERQPGSCIKPLLDYGPALNEGIVTAGKILNDSKITVKGFTPSNMNGMQYGNISVREALGRSVNTIALKVFNMTGQKTCLSYLDALQFSTMQYADMITPAISIGGFTTGVTVEDMAKGYASIANEGKFSTNTCLKSLKDRTGKEIYKVAENEKEVYSKDTAFILTDMMVGVFEEDYGTARKMKNKNQVYAGKTGTTNDSKDAWFCGFSKYYTTVVWCGYDTPRAVDGLYGSSYPGTIWKTFMDEIHKGKKKSEFLPPESIKLSNGTTEKAANGLSRPDGWDYVSSSLREKIEEEDAKREEKELEKAAENAVSNYEDFQITSISTAQDAENQYEKASSAVRKVGDSSIRSELMRRVSKKHDALSQSLINKWNQAIEESESAEQEQKEAENIEQAQKSLEEAEKIKKESLISTAEWYIDHLNARTLYSEYTQKMIEDGENAVSACASLPEYSIIRNNFEEAKKYAKSLPTEIPETTAPEPSYYPEDDGTPNDANEIVIENN